MNGFSVRVEARIALLGEEHLIDETDKFHFFFLILFKFLTCFYEMF